MAIRLAVLIALAALALAAPTALAAARAPGPACAGCHAGRHYARYGTCADCHRGDPLARRKSLAHDRLLKGDAAAWSIPGASAVAEGRALRERLGCRRCHVSGGAGNTYALSLDAIVWRRTQDELRRSIQQPATFMPDFGLSTRQVDAILAALLRDGDRRGREERYLVHFRSGAPRTDAFGRNCGPCHRALTPRGPLGVGSSGPNLSGLLSGFYPATDGRAWDRTRLERWVRNPRAEKPTTTMLPVPLKPGELDEIASLLGGPATSRDRAR